MWTTVFFDHANRLGFQGIIHRFHPDWVTTSPLCIISTFCGYDKQSAPLPWVLLAVNLIFSDEKDATGVQRHLRLSCNSQILAIIWQTGRVLTPAHLIQIVFQLGAPHKPNKGVYFSGSKLIWPLYLHLPFQHWVWQMSGSERCGV